MNDDIQRIERTIRWYGLLRVPADIKQVKWWRLYADIIRPPISPYSNEKYQNPKGFYGYIQNMYGGRVAQTYTHEFDNQILIENSNTNLFLHQSISCSLEAVLSSFVNLFIALPRFPIIQRNNPIKDWQSYGWVPEEFRVKLLTEQTVIKLTFEYAKMQKCEVPESEEPEPPPPPPPPPPPKNPSGSPDNQLPPISDAYDGANDGGLTYKPEQPVNPEVPPTEECIAYRVTTNTQEALGIYVERTNIVFGIIKGLILELDSNSNTLAWKLICGGFQACIQDSKLIISTSIPAGSLGEITVVEQI